MSCAAAFTAAAAVGCFKSKQDTLFSSQSAFGSCCRGGSNSPQLWDRTLRRLQAGRGFALGAPRKNNFSGPRPATAAQPWPGPGLGLAVRRPGQSSAGRSALLGPARPCLVSLGHAGVPNSARLTPSPFPLDPSNLGRKFAACSRGCGAGLRKSRRAPDYFRWKWILFRPDPPRTAPPRRLRPSECPTPCGGLAAGWPRGARGRRDAGWGCR